jgi:hypothetical protein
MIMFVGNGRCPKQIDPFLICRHYSERIGNLQGTPVKRLPTKKFGMMIP